MKKGKLVSLAAAAFAFALLFGACEKKGDETAPPSSTSTSQAPTDKSPTDQSTPASPSTGSDSPDSGSAQKPDDASKAQKG